MKTSTLKLCLPVIAMTALQSAAAIIIPPYLDDLKYPLPAIGSLVSLGPILSLAARLPSGLAYRVDRARLLLAGALTIMTLSTFLYAFAAEAIYFALVQALFGFAYGAATTIYLAFFVEALPPDEDRHHAMGYYAGCLAIGYSAGGFAAGYLADRLGYVATFKVVSLLGLLCLILLFFLRPPSALDTRKDSLTAVGTPSVFESLRNILDPKMATIVVVALFLNMLHQMGSVFIPLYCLAVGLTLTQVGVIKALYALCNAITRPMSGSIFKRFGSRILLPTGLPLQAMFLMLVPFFQDLGTLLVVFVLSGFMRAVVIVANTISMVEDVDSTRVSRGMASGIFNAAGDIGNILGPSTGGLIASITGVARLFFFGPLLIAILFCISLWSCRFLRTGD